MLPRYNFARAHFRHVKIFDVNWRAIADFQVEHLVEVAIIQVAVPTDGERISAHHAFGGGRIEQRDEFRHIRFIISRHQQIIQEATNWHVGNRVEMIEHNAVVLEEFAFVIFLERTLIWRQKRTNRIVDEVKH